MLGYTGKIELKDSWHILKISHKGNKIKAFLDGDMKLTVNSGQHITQHGGVGLWTKADAATSFDNFTVVRYCYLSSRFCLNLFTEDRNLASRFKPEV